MEKEKWKVITFVSDTESVTYKLLEFLNENDVVDFEIVEEGSNYIKVIYQD